MFACAPAQRARLARDMDAYLRALGIPPWQVVKRDPGDGRLVYTLATPETDTDTLDLAQRKAYRIRAARVRLPGPDGEIRAVRTVSRKEILLALLQHGRLTQLRGAACSVDALREHVGVRQNVVAWTSRLSWGWPDGGPARWNARVWDDGRPRAGVSLDHALRDPFLHQARYDLGCYTASKLSYAQAVLDYYVRVRPDPAKAALVRARLLHDQDPLVGVEPAGMWDFEADFDPRRAALPGKLLAVTRGVAPRNFVPGDWSYLRNTDPATATKTGYEGSNAVYLGGGRFVDYYNDNNHAYTFVEKLDEVYQWRNGVFSRRRDGDKAEPLTRADFVRLSRTPAEGGLLLDLRAVPYLFGYQRLPSLPAP
jgi:hypothetical protein